MKSLVRVSKEARTPGTAEHQAAVREFINKMGGDQTIIDSLFNTFDENNKLVPTPTFRPNPKDEKKFGNQM